MAANSNIPALALEKVSSMVWGVSNGKDVSRDILINYVNNLACAGINVVNCMPDKCAKTPDITEISCSLMIQGIMRVPPATGAQLAFSPTGMSNVKFPVVYDWTYSAADFILVSKEDNAINLNYAVGKNDGNITTTIKLKVTDANGCVAEKECFVLPNSQMNCSGTYAPCIKPKNLTVTIV